MLHQFGGRQIIYLPQARHDALRSGVHKPARQSDQPLAFDLLAERRLTGAQHNEIGGQSQVVDFVHSQKTVLLFSVLINERERQSRQFGIFAVEQAVRGEMNDATISNRFPFNSWRSEPAI